ncbi:MAG: BlaI/MecI/CopY family transcriptional regulator [Hungatella sp.]|nr:BlaI/MecI/CopY family transcriptional regulator [Hungatella sp.]
MMEIQLGVIESRFADMIWEQEPVTTSELVKMAEKTFQWKRTTTHTVVKRLCEKGLFVNTMGTVTSLISRREFLSMQSRKFVEDTFHGSLPAFIAAFTGKNTLTPEEAAKIQAIIDQTEEE